MAENLTDRVVILTGAAGGLGLAYARYFASQGAHLLLADAELPGVEERLTALADEVSADGRQATTFTGDVSDEASVDVLVGTAIDAFGRVDAVVNNAGNWYESPLVDWPADEWDSVVNVHLRGHFLLIRAAARHWRDNTAERGRRAVVNTTSRSALNAVRGHSGYAAAKAGIVALTQIAAQELEAYDANVNCIAPAARTPMLQQLKHLTSNIERPESPEAFDAWHPSNVAPLVAFLASASCNVTGQVIFNSGGVVQPYHLWAPGAALERTEAWTFEAIAEQLPAALSAHARDPRL